MISTIEINQLKSLPNETLAILKDDIENSDSYSLALKDHIDTFNNIQFKINFIVCNSIPICILMLKINDKFYKCLISFELKREFDYFKKMMSLKYFNLFLVNDKFKIDIRKIENKKYKNLSNAISAVSNSNLEHSYYDITLAKEMILNDYSDEMLWNIK